MQKESSTYVALSHNVSNLVYHFVCPAKYRRSVFSDNVEAHLWNICQEIELRYDYIKFLEIGADNNHVHSLVQSTLCISNPKCSFNEVSSINKVMGHAKRS